MHLIEFKMCVIAGSGSRVVVTHQIFNVEVTIKFYYTTVLKNRILLIFSSEEKNFLEKYKHEIYGLNFHFINQIMPTLNI